MEYAFALIDRLVRGLRQFGPYILLELLLPGGSILALALWLYRRGAIAVAPAHVVNGSTGTVQAHCSSPAGHHLLRPVPSAAGQWLTPASAFKGRVTVVLATLVNGKDNPRVASLGAAH